MGKKQQKEIKKPKMNWFLIIALILLGALLIGVIVSYVWEISVTALLYNLIKNFIGGEELNG